MKTILYFMAVVSSVVLTFWFKAILPEMFSGEAQFTGMDSLEITSQCGSQCRRVIPEGERTLMSGGVTHDRNCYDQCLLRGKPYVD